jgi:alpha-galactosidase
MSSQPSLPLCNIKEYFMKKIFLSIFLQIFVSYPCMSQSTAAMDSKSVNVQKWITTHFAHGKVPPFSFKYGDINSSEFIKKWKYTFTELPSTEPFQKKYLVSYKDSRTGLKVDCNVTGYSDYGVVEWVLHFTNEGSQNTQQISQVRTSDINFRYPHDGKFKIHYANGSNAGRDDFSPKEKELSTGDSLKMRSSGGRSSDSAFPFFNIESPAQQGVLVSIGWTGTWSSNIRCIDSRTISLTSGTDRLNTYLFPKESIRSSSICLLFWKGADRMTGHNNFRRFLLAHHSRHIDGKPVYYPMSCGFNWGDPEPCNEYSCLTTEYAIALIQRTKLFKIVPEVFWLDAGWFKQSADYFDNKNWGNTVGNWVVDSTRFEKGLRPVSDAAHKIGAKFMVWFEPERVYPGTLWDTQHPEWLLKTDDENLLFNLGNPDALKWICKTIGDFLEDNGIDYYRQDFNIAPENAWSKADEPKREGMTEVKYIEGLYKYWDYLIQRFPKLLIDNCASGGRRLDYETVLRSAPMWRTDYQYGEPVGYQCHTYGLEFYLPQHGTGAYFTNRFDFRSSLSSAVVYNWKLTQQGQSFLEMQKCMKEFNEVRPYFYEDYYPLSGVGDITKDDIWLAYQLNKPSDGTGYILAFRRDKNMQSTYDVRLSGLQPNKTYVLQNKDTGETIKRTGQELAAGLTLTLDKPRTSLLIRYWTVPSLK